MSRGKTLERKLPGKRDGTAKATPPQPRKRAPTKGQWASGHLVAALLIGVAVGVVIGMSISRSPESESAAVAASGTAPGTVAPIVTTPLAPAGIPAGAMQMTTDPYGRSPGDEHYGHNHP